MLAHEIYLLLLGHKPVPSDVNEVGGEDRLERGRVIFVLQPPLLEIANVLLGRRTAAGKPRQESRGAGREEDERD